MSKALIAAVAFAVGGCGDPTGGRSLFAISDDDFYALPFPNDLRRHADGSLDLSKFPTNSLIVDSYRAAVETLDGFGLNSAISARFDVALDPASLPDPAASMTVDADGHYPSVYLANLADGSLVPIVASFRADGTQTIGGNRLVVRPYPGFGLAEGTTYALVMTTRLRAANGGDIDAADGWLDLASGAGVQFSAAQQAAYAPLLAWLAQPGGDEVTDVVSAAVFTTQHFSAIVPALRRAIYAAPAPVAADVMLVGDNGIDALFTGTYEAPNFQMGAVPYQSAPTGQIQIGTDGDAIVQRTESMRFALTVPIGVMPAAGWPICIYAHGTDGDYRSFVEDGTAQRLGAEGIAVLSTDQVLHGPRNPGGNPEIDFFNFGNPYAARDNPLQGTADAIAQLRLALGFAIPNGAQTIKVDPTKVYFFGHSQGGVTGPGFVAFEPTLRGAVFSGTAGVLYLALLHKTAPLDIPALVQQFLRDDPVDEDNPSLALAQTWVERSDSANFAPFMVRDPQLAPDGTPLAPRNIYQSEGFTDTFAPNPGIEAFATALGGDVIALPDEADVPGLLELRGRAVKSGPFSNNLDGVTAALGQYKQAAGSDGHYVVFEVPSAMKQSAEFLGTLARTGTATIVAP